MALCMHGERRNPLAPPCERERARGGEGGAAAMTEVAVAVGRSVETAGVEMGVSQVGLGWVVAMAAVIARCCGCGSVLGRQRGGVAVVGGLRLRRC